MPLSLPDQFWELNLHRFSSSVGSWQFFFPLLLTKIVNQCHIRFFFSNNIYWQNTTPYSWKWQHHQVSNIPRKLRSISRGNAMKRSLFSRIWIVWRPMSQIFTLNEWSTLSFGNCTACKGSILSGKLRYSWNLQAVHIFWLPLLTISTIFFHPIFCSGRLELRRLCL